MPSDNLDEFKQSDSPLLYNLVRRTNQVSESNEQLLRELNESIRRLMELSRDTKDSIEDLNKLRRSLETEKMFYIFLGICIGLAGRQILKDVIGLIG